MKKLILPLMFSIALLISGCKKDVDTIKGCMDPTSANYNENANTDDGSCYYAGHVTFYTNQAYPGGIAISCGSGSGYLTQYYANGAPSCGATGCGNFYLKVGTYSFYGFNTTGTAEWSGTVTVTANSCTTVLLP